MNKVAISIMGGSSFVAEVTHEAARLDRSPSWLLGHCLSTTLPKLEASLAAVAPAKSAPRMKRTKRVFHVPENVIEHCRRLAARLGVTKDDIVAWAWRAGRDDIRALPTS